MQAASQPLIEKRLGAREPQKTSGSFITTPRLRSCKKRVKVSQNISERNLPCALSDSVPRVIDSYPYYAEPDGYPKTARMGPIYIGTKRKSYRSNKRGCFAGREALTQQAIEKEASDRLVGTIRIH